MPLFVLYYGRLAKHSFTKAHFRNFHCRHGTTMTDCNQDTSSAASTTPSTFQEAHTPLTPPMPEPKAEPDLAPASSEQEAPPHLALQVFFGIMLAFMANHIKLPLAGSAPAVKFMAKFAVSDIAFLLAFGVAVCVILCQRRRLQFPKLCLLPVLAAAVANVFAQTYLPGAIETAQTAMMLVGGVTLFSFMVRTMPRTTLIGMSAGLALNLIVAGVQLMQSGAYLALAPRDILELKWGLGSAMTGLFRSSMALSVYLALTVAWTFPQWFGLTSRLFGLWSVVSEFLLAVLAALCLLLIPNAMLAIVAAAVLIIGTAVCSTRAVSAAVLAVILALVLAFSVPQLKILETWKASVSPLKGYDYAPNAAVLFNSREPIENDDAAPTAHELKTSHYDFMAAVRTAVNHPWYGVGSGNYQLAIGKSFGLDEEHRFAPLPKPQLNDIPTDTQAGWGILLATLGFPATFAFALFFLIALGKGLKQLQSDEEDGLRLHLGAVLALLVFILAMFLSDPLTKGLGWNVALAVASACVLLETRSHGKANTLKPLWLMVCLGVTALTLVAVAIGVPKAQPKSKKQHLSLAPAAPTPAPSPTPAPTPAPAEPQPTATVAAPTDDSHVLKAPDEDELFLLFNANRAVSITLPMRKIDDENGDYSDGVLYIPDKAGVPPEGRNPALEYGGCVFEFEVTRETSGYLWFNVMWDGSCGNTLDVALDDSKESYTVGNDGTYNAWHWQKSPKTYHLKPGRHKITVLNREDGIKLAQVLLLNDKEYIPEGKEEP